MKIKLYCALTECVFKNSEGICTARSGDKCIFSYIPVTKPPLGVMPREIWDRKRQDQLAEAMTRYLEAGYKIPKEWFDEYNEISERLKEIKEWYL